MFCRSTKNKKSSERCSYNSLAGMQFCGKHAKVKNPKIWSATNIQSISAIKIQKIWRGFMLTNFLKLSGKGCLKRSLCHNDEELVTFEEKNRQHPLNYFSFKENDRLWWFSLDSAIKLCHQETPTNPYTKEPLSLETRARIHELIDICWYRKLFKMVESAHTKAVMLSQILEEQLFEKISPLQLENMSKLSMIIFTENLRDSLEFRSINSSPQRRKHLFIIETCLTKQLCPRIEHEFLIFQLLSSILYILKTSKNKFPLCFLILGALHTI